MFAQLPPEKITWTIRRNAFLLWRICQDDLIYALDQEDNAGGRCEPPTHSPTLAGEYERRFGVPLPPPGERGASWFMYHCPPAFIWQLTLNTTPDLTRADHHYHLQTVVQVSGPTRVIVEKEAEKELIERAGTTPVGLIHIIIDLMRADKWWSQN
jgi:hypothetical protein